ncbi:MAG: copper chaperone PCu(A)C [Alphaproteobacteria bacterium]|nr:MAG: copper chaperone PCu(A)C [Alphaproteobacteria bacterium]
MKRLFERTWAGLLCALALAGTASGHDYQAGSVMISHAYARVAYEGARSGAIYFSLRNEGAADDRLLSVSTPAAQRAELHHSIEENGVMRMRAVDGGIAVPAGGNVSLAPGGMHIMLFGLNQPLMPGDRFQAVLHFEKAGAVAVEVQVEAPPAAAAPHQHHH